MLVELAQRFGSDLRTNLHLHGLVLDGAYGEHERGQRRFFTAPAPSPAEARALLEDDEPEAPAEDEELALAQSLGHASRSRDVQAHRPDPTPEPNLGIVYLPSRRKARIDGFDLDAEVCCPRMAPRDPRIRRRRSASTQLQWMRHQARNQIR